MSDAYDYFKAHAIAATQKARALPLGRDKRKQRVAARVYHLLAREAAFAPNVHHLDEFRAAQRLERQIHRQPAKENSMSKETPKDDPRQQNDEGSLKQTDRPWKGNPEKEQRSGVKKSDLARWQRTNTH